MSTSGSAGGGGGGGGGGGAAAARPGGGGIFRTLPEVVAADCAGLAVETAFTVTVDFPGRG